MTVIISLTSQKNGREPKKLKIEIRATSEISIGSAYYRELFAITEKE